MPVLFRDIFSFIAAIPCANSCTAAPIKIATMKYGRVPNEIVTPGITGVIAIGVTSLDFGKKNVMTLIVNIISPVKRIPRPERIPISHNSFQSDSFFLAIREIRLFSFVVR